MLFVRMCFPMEIRNIFKVSRKTFFNPSGWFGYEILKEQHETIKENVRAVLKPAKAAREETFEAAIQRLGLTEADVKQRMITYTRYTYFFCFCAAIIFFYSFYLLFRHWVITPWLMGMGVTGLFLSQAFKFHFWVYQMQLRRLGVSFQEWKNHVLGHKGITQ